MNHFFRGGGGNDLNEPSEGKGGREEYIERPSVQNHVHLTPNPESVKCKRFPTPLFEYNIRSEVLCT